VKCLYVLFDAECALCQRCRHWLARQPAYIRLEFIPLQSPELSRRFPGIEALKPSEQLLVVSDAGAVYRGASAWIMCLYALRDYREWSQRLAAPALLPWARRVCELLSQHRLSFSRALSRKTSAEIGARLARYNAGPLAICPTGQRCGVK
jgi:predicted DCC family thiol-disulfide oxidoreductase YuxK